VIGGECLVVRTKQSENERQKQPIRGSFAALEDDGEEHATAETPADPCEDDRKKSNGKRNSNSKRRSPSGMTKEGG
jgi:hypothetical protein